MFGIGVQELALIFVIALLIFGPKRLPELARTLGKGMAEFRRASADLRQSFSLDTHSPPPRRPLDPPPGDPREQRDTHDRPSQSVGSATVPASEEAEPGSEAEGSPPQPSGSSPTGKSPEASGD